MIQQTQKFLDELAKRLDLEYVFLFPPINGASIKQQLLIVVNPAKGLSPQSIVPTVSLCLSEMEDIAFDIIFSGEWLNHIKRGSLYYHYVALPEHLIFRCAERNPSVFRPKNILAILEKGNQDYERSINFSNDFLLGAQRFMQKGTLGRAVYMLHQYLELRVKGIQGTGVINGGKAHRIENALKQVGYIVPEIGALITGESPQLPLFRLSEKYLLRSSLVFLQ